MNPLIPLIVALGVAGLTTSLLFSLNTVIKSIYYWEREVTFVDYINTKKVYIKFPNESLTSNSLTKEIPTEELYEKFELIITGNNTTYIPYKSMLSGIIDIFLDYRNVIGALQNAEEEYRDEPQELELFKDYGKFDLPSVMHGTDIYNMYTKYTLYDLDNQKEILITSSEEYSTFVQRVLDNKSNLSYRTHYMIYKKVGVKEDGQLISELITTFNIGQDYQDLTNTRYLIDVQY